LSRVSWGETGGDATEISFGALGCAKTERHAESKCVAVILNSCPLFVLDLLKVAATAPSRPLTVDCVPLGAGGAL